MMLIPLALHAAAPKEKHRILSWQQLIGEYDKGYEYLKQDIKIEMLRDFIRARYCKCIEDERALSEIIVRCMNGNKSLRHDTLRAISKAYEDRNADAELYAENIYRVMTITDEEMQQARCRLEKLDFTRDIHAFSYRQAVSKIQKIHENTADVSSHEIPDDFLVRERYAGKLVMLLAFCLLRNYDDKILLPIKKRIPKFARKVEKSAKRMYQFTR